MTNDELERPAMSDLVRFDVGISGGLITSAEGKWVSYASHCASRDALVNVVDAQADEIERLRQRLVEAEALLREVQSLYTDDHTQCMLCGSILPSPSACNHFPGQVKCEWCHRNVGFNGLWHAPNCPALNFPVQKDPQPGGSGDGEGNEIDPT